MSKKTRSILSFTATVLIILAVFLLRSPLFHQDEGESGEEIVSLETEELTATNPPQESVAETEKAKPTATPTPEATAAATNLKFRSKKLLNEHYKKHGIEMGFASAKEYEAAAAAVVANPDALHKTEKEDGDDVYYLEETNEFVIVSKDGYLRTYFLPSAGKKYYDKQ